ncbi:MAG: head GIN domain-containing protein [Chitinophagaceae bacterium]
MKQSLIILAAASLIVFSSCEKVVGEGPVVTETRMVDSFTGVSSGFSATVNYTIGPVLRVEVQGQQNVLDVLKTSSSNGILTVDFKDNARVKSHEPVIVNITAPSLDYITQTGSGNIFAKGHIVSTRLDINISGSGNISVEDAVISDKIDARVSGSGHLVITTGAAKNETLQVSGSGYMDLVNVPAQNADVHISGSGYTKVNLSQSLDAHISGSGDVWYLGNPVISTHISGSGKVRQL